MNRISIFELQTHILKPPHGHSFVLVGLGKEREEMVTFLENEHIPFNAKELASTSERIILNYDTRRLKDTL